MGDIHAKGPNLCFQMSAAGKLWLVAFDLGGEDTLLLSSFQVPMVMRGIQQKMSICPKFMTK